MVYLSICLCHLWFLSLRRNSFLSTGLLSPYISLLLSILLFFLAVVNEIVSLISLSDLLLLLYRNAWDLCALISYTAILPFHWLTLIVFWWHLNFFLCVVSGHLHGFSSSHVWMWELGHKEGWVPKNWLFWTMVLEKILESPLDSKRTNQPILREINPKYSLEGLVLKLQYFGHLMWRSGSLEKTLMLWKIEGKRRRGWQRMTWLNGITDSMDMSVRTLREIWRIGKPDVLQFTGSQRVGHDLTTVKHHHHHIYMCLWVRKISDSHLASTLKEGSWYLRRNRRGETTICHKTGVTISQSSPITLD